MGKSLNDYRVLIEQKLQTALDSIDSACPKALKEAMNYSLLAGGKRIRPVLALMTADMLRPRASGESRVSFYALAVEFVHNYSLIHDDLPSMDNDSLRRGRPTNHIVYGEAIAILAGDGLLTSAFELQQPAIDAADTPEDKLRVAEAFSYLARMAGQSGMVAGQVIDLTSEGQSLDIDMLKHLQSLKTGCLLKAAIVGMAILLGAAPEVLALLEAFALELGLAFQIRDDVLDVAATAETLGKTPGKDEAAHKATYVTLLGLEDALKHLTLTNQRALECCNLLSSMGFDVSALQSVTEALSRRDS